MIILDPETVGCGRKVPPEALSTLQTTFQEYYGTKQFLDFDASVLSSGSIVVSSIDRTARFSESDDIFVKGTFAHASNDVLCGRARPKLVSVSLGIARREFDRDGGVGLVSSVARQLKSMELHPAKLHTYIDAETNLTIGVVGERSFKLPDSEASEGTVVLTGPIGAMKLTYLSSIGHNVGGVEAAMQSIVKWDINLVSEVSPFVHALTDVSGFGLAHALDQLMQQQSATCGLDTASIPVFDQAVDGIPVDCLDKGRTATLHNVRLSSAEYESRLFVSEVNGPLILLVADENVSKVRGIAQRNFHQIGRWSKS